MLLIELVEGFYVNPKLVAVVKSTDADQCALFISGQSAVDGGFTLPYSADEIAVALNDEEEEGDEEESEDDEEEEDDDDNG